MALDNFSALKTAIANLLDRDDLATHIPDFISIAEARFRRDIRIREMIKRSQAPATARFLALPSDFLEMKNLRFLTNPVTVLAEINLHEMNRQRSETTGTPRFYTIHEEIEFDVVPSTTLTTELFYYAEIPGLSDAQTTNALLTIAPDVYLYGSLVASAPFLNFDERLQTWAGLYTGAAQDLVSADRRARHGGPLVARISGGTP